jgi:hypothetical protein
MDPIAAAILTDAKSRMAEEMPRTMSGFAYKGDETTTSSSSSPFHGFTKADATPAIRNPFRLIHPGVAVRQLQVE